MALQDQINSLFDNLWQQFIEITPSAKRIHKLLGRGQPVYNDHIALRTFDLAPVNLERIADHFVVLGYEKAQQYNFANKHLSAVYYEPPRGDLPKVFISELLTAELSDHAQQIIRQLVAQVEDSAVGWPEFLYSGRPWQVSSEDYKTLCLESQYAAWLAAWGYRANHFTVAVNRLTGFRSIAQVNAILLKNDVVLNTVGGEIKGSPSVFLEQSATVADDAAVTFSDGVTLEIPGCFYEFALRHPLPSGELFPGFVEANADRIFHSTDTVAHRLP